jgi:hypothetical protein
MFTIVNENGFIPLMQSLQKLILAEGCGKGGNLMVWRDRLREVTA